jgi:cytoskeletal protein CcmA (bactofilin family)
MKKIIHGLLLLTVLLIPTRAVSADDGAGNGRVVIGQDFTLSAGETLDGDLVVIGGTATVEYGGVVQGDIVIIGGSLRLDGETQGNAVVIGGAVSVGERATVASDVITLGGSLNRATGAHIGGDIVTNMPLPAVGLPRVGIPPAAPVAPEPPMRFDLGPLGAAAAILLQALGLAALAMLLTAFLHPQLDRVAQALVAQPFMVGSIGLLTVFVAPIAVVILAITLILIPVALAAVILLVLGWLFGVVALGMVIGDRLAQASHSTMEPVISAGLGTLLLGLIVGTVQHVPCVGWIAPVLVGLIGLGAAVITMFGTRPMVRTAMGGAPTGPEGTSGGPAASPV